MYCRAMIGQDDLVDASKTTYRIIDTEAETFQEAKKIITPLLKSGEYIFYIFNCDDLKED